MKRSMSNYPVDARWEVVSDNGVHGTICLISRTPYMETWVWSVCYGDKSGYRSDWRTSYSGCREEIPIWNSSKKPIRFRRMR